MKFLTKRPTTLLKFLMKFLLKILQLKYRKPTIFTRFFTAKNISLRLKYRILQKVEKCHLTPPVFYRAHCIHFSTFSIFWHSSLFHFLRSSDIVISLYEEANYMVKKSNLALEELAEELRSEPASTKLAPRKKEKPSKPVTGNEPCEQSIAEPEPSSMTQLKKRSEAISVSVRTRREALEQKGGDER